jgi:pantothenate kinase
MDAIAIRRNAIPLFGKTLSRALKEKISLNNVKEIYLALDADATEQAMKIAQVFAKQNINVYVVETEGKDPGEIGFERMSKLIRNTEPFTFKQWVNKRVNSGV